MIDPWRHSVTNVDWGLASDAVVGAGADAVGADAVGSVRVPLAALLSALRPPRVCPPCLPPREASQMIAMLFPMHVETG